MVHETGPPTGTGKRTTSGARRSAVRCVQRDVDGDERERDGRERDGADWRSILCAQYVHEVHVSGVFCESTLPYTDYCTFVDALVA